MRTPGLKRLTIAALGVSLLWAVQSFAQSLKQVGVIDLPGPKGQRFDYLTMDDEDHYLLSAHLGPGILYVIDVRTNALVKAISGVPGITGVEYIPTLHKVYTSDWGEEKIGLGHNRCNWHFTVPSGVLLACYSGRLALLFSLLGKAKLEIGHQLL